MAQSHQAVRRDEAAILHHPGSPGLERSADGLGEIGRQAGQRRPLGRDLRLVGPVVQFTDE
jgi:hypothetical protein